MFFLWPILASYIYNYFTLHHDPRVRATTTTTQLYVPFYGSSANGHRAPARGWNSFGLQANPLVARASGFVFDDAQ